MINRVEMESINIFFRVYELCDINALKMFWNRKLNKASRYKFPGTTSQPVATVAMSYVDYTRSAGVG